MYRYHLLSLFTACRSCHQLCDGEVANLKGIFISIRQSCHHCGYTWVRNSQPFIRDTPAANILLSAAILFSGSTPGKIFHFLECLRVACTTDRTFHTNHSNIVTACDDQLLVLSLAMSCQPKTEEHLLIQISPYDYWISLHCSVSNSEI